MQYNNMSEFYNLKRKSNITLKAVKAHAESRVILIYEAQWQISSDTFCMLTAA